MRIFIFALLLTLFGVAVADTRYVGDQLIVTLRSDSGDNYQVLRSLPSGTKLDLLETDGKYAKVRTQDGVEGWISSQYLTDQPIARDQLAATEQKLATLDSENQKLKQQLTALKSDNASTSAAQQKLSSENDKLQKELAHLKEVAAHPAELAKDNQEMHQQLQQLDLQSHVLKEENTALRDRTNRDWFLAGAGVLLLGLIIGAILPRLRKRSGWTDWH